MMKLLNYCNKLKRKRIHNKVKQNKNYHVGEVIYEKKHGERIIDIRNK